MMRAGRGMRALRTILLIFLFVWFSTTCHASGVKRDEQVVFFTTAAHRDGDSWVVPVHAWVFDPEEHSLMRNGAISMAAESLELENSPTFRAHIRWFLVDNQRGKKLRTTLGPDVIGYTGANGHAEAVLRVTLPPADELSFNAVLPAGDNRLFTGHAILVPEEGVSVISDIDDTIKVTEVTDRGKMMENTFVNPFRAAPGMADAYKRLAAAGAMFHYVSSSPWQLYPVLEPFMQQEGFPRGSMHFRIFRMKDRTFLNMALSSEETKPPVIEKLMADFPKRSFILIGDSGEKDPEIYGAIARAHPGRIRHIYIRHVTGDKTDDARYTNAFTGLDGLWTVFDDAAVITAQSVFGP